VVNRYNTDTYTGGTVYLGKDILGSVRGVSNDYGLLEDRYEYDAFGKPYKGDLNGGMNLGYTGKPYDTATGLYNYGYRDYQLETARFTAVDPIRDGANWFAYVNNDPVNYVDLRGLETIFYYEDHRVLDDPRAEIYMDATTTYYSSSEETISQYRENSIDNFIQSFGGLFWRSEDDPENSFENNQYGANNKVTFSPVESAELPSGIPKPPEGGVASRPGSAEQNGFKTSCGN
jgi:RHS repeat-associated protein